MAARRRRPRSRRRTSYRVRRAAARRMRTVRASAPRHHRRRRPAVYQRRRLRNPRAGGAGFSKRGIIHMATGAGVGAIGAVALDYLWQYASTNFIPAQYQSGYLGTGVKLVAALGAGYLASKVVGKHTAMAGTAGALTVIAYQLAHQMIAGVAPTAAIASTTTTATPAVAGLRAYMRPSSALGWVSPGSPLRGLGRVGAYMAGNMPPNMNRPGGSVSMSGLAMPGGY